MAKRGRPRKGEALAKNYPRLPGTYEDEAQTFAGSVVPEPRECLEVMVSLDRPLNAAELKILSSLSTAFPIDEVAFLAEKDGIRILLSVIDPHDLRERINTLVLDHQTISEGSAPDPDIFARLIEAIEDIRSYGIKNGKRIYATYNQERKVQGRKEKVKTRGSFFYARTDFSREITSLPEQYLDRIICGDAEVVLKSLPEGSVDIVFTSPPYNFGLGYDTGEDGISWEDYFTKLFAVFSECIRVLKYGGRIIVNVQPLFSDYIPIHHIISKFFMDQGLIWKGEVLWEKNNYNCKYTAWGSWKSPSNPYLKYTWEFVEIFSKGELKKAGDRANIDISADEFKKWVVAKWSIGTERNMKDFNHPAMFPQDLVERTLKLFSYQGDIVLDPFNGAGTTTVVAKRLGRRYLGIDISEEYCKTAERRIKEMLPNSPLC
jgi:DNA modification methylase